MCRYIIESTLLLTFVMGLDSMRRWEEPGRQIKLRQERCNLQSRALFSCREIVAEIYFAGLRKTKKFQKNFSELPRQRGEKTPYIGEEVKGSWKSIDICRTKRGGDEERKGGNGVKGMLFRIETRKGDRGVTCGKHPKNHSRLIKVPQPAAGHFWSRRQAAGNKREARFSRFTLREERF